MRNYEKPAWEQVYEKGIKLEFSWKIIQYRGLKLIVSMQYKVFGCKVNKYYTDRWLNSDYLSDKSWTFVASCVVTDSAKRKWVRFVKKELEHISENGKIYISGCGAFKDGKAQTDFFEIYPELWHAQDKIEVLDEALSLNSNKHKKLKFIHVNIYSSSEDVIVFVPFVWQFKNVEDTIIEQKKI